MPTLAFLRLRIFVNLVDYEIVSVTVNVMCQLDWVMRYPGIWLNMIPGVSVEVFLDEINI